MWGEGSGGRGGVVVVVVVRIRVCGSHIWFVPLCAVAELDLLITAIKEIVVSAM